MKSILTILFFLSTFPLHAQLPDGSTAPDWTATDTEGNEWNLYDVLASGKPVVLEITATWSGDSWGYHEGGALAAFYEQYGPDGTDEAMVFFIEADDATTAADLDGTGGDTQGDWLENTPYPIIDDAEFVANLYEAYGYPSHLLICPNRLLTEVGFPSTFSLFSLSQNCLSPFGQNNAGIYGYVGFEGDFCGEHTFAPSIIWQNLGTENITSAELELYRGGSLEEAISWTGNLPPFALDPQAFAPVTVSEDADFQLVIASVNGVADEDASNNTWQIEATVAPETDGNFLTLEILTDEYPTETYWEILDENGTVFHSGGNPGIFDDMELPGSYTDQNTSYFHDIALPVDGCYEFVIYDQYDDGICCDNGFGYYRLFGEDNSILLQGGLFGSEERRPFSLSGAATILANAEIINYGGPSGDFCGTLVFQPELTVRNLGSEALTSLHIQATNLAEEVVQDFTHDTDLPSGQTEAVTLDAITVDAFDLLRYRILEVNGQPDVILPGNVELVLHERRIATSPALNLEIQTDEWGYEIYWEMRASSGKVVANGGNLNVGPDGGGARVATADDPGAYPNFETFTEQILLPDGANECFEFLFVDDWGDGLGGNGFLKLTDEAGNILFNIFPEGTYESHLIDAQLAPSNTAEILELNALHVFPNPVGDELNISFSLSQNTELSIGLFDVLGRQVATVADGDFIMGENKLSVDMDGYATGVYLVRITSGEGQVVRRVFKGERW